MQVGLAPCMIWGVDEPACGRPASPPMSPGSGDDPRGGDAVRDRAADSRYGQTDTDFLGESGFSKPDVLAVHCVKCSSADIAMLRRHGMKVSHNPCSNIYLASGLAPIPGDAYGRRHSRPGEYGPASSNNHSLFQAMKFAALIQKGVHGDATIITAQKVLEMATIDGAQAVGLGDQIGSIEVGKKADLVL